MARNNNPANFARRDKAAEEKKKVSYTLALVRFEYVEDGADILLLEGPYAGKTVKQVFLIGEEERDYIIKQLWYRGDQKINAIIEGMLYQEV